MALVAAGTLSRNAPFIECVKFVAFNGKSLLRPQAKAFVVPSATIIAKIYQPPDFRAEPWPYREKGFNWFHYIYDKAQWRFNENTKMILVEGPIASGKTTLAKQLAEDLDMCYFPEPSADQWFTNEYGFNVRELNCKLPKTARFINKEDFYREPNMRTATQHQTTVNQMATLLYFEALSHVLNTGQGVILDRALFSNTVNIEALIECGYLRPAYRRYYKDCYFNLALHMLRPHLVIYLDVPVDTVQERVKKRGIDYELNTPVLSRQYLSAMEKVYKQQFLPQISIHAELLVYDWSNFGDAEVVVEDIELIDFDKYIQFDAKLEDWRVHKDRYWGIHRIMSTENRGQFNNMWIEHHSDIPEMFIENDDWEARNDAITSHPTGKYAVGYNAAAGDTNILWKLRSYGQRFGRFND